MQWFQYKASVAGETQRVTHCAKQTLDSGQLHSWCHREFDPTQMEAAAEPGATPTDGQARPGAPCIPCLLLVMAATDTSKELESGEAPVSPAELW